MELLRSLDEIDKEVRQQMLNEAKFNEEQAKREKELEEMDKEMERLILSDVE